MRTRDFSQGRPGDATSGAANQGLGRRFLPLLLPLALAIMAVEIVAIVQSLNSTSPSTTRTAERSAPGLGNESVGAPNSGARPAPTQGASKPSNSDSRAVGAAPPVTVAPTATPIVVATATLIPPPTTVPATAVPAPAVAEAPVPAAAPKPAVEAKPAPEPPAKPAPAAVTGPPVDAVSRFYQLTERHDFAGAAQLWTPRLQQQYPPGEFIAGRFSRVQHLQIQNISVVSQNDAAGQATVAVELSESSADPSFNGRWVGSWRLVRVNGAWLLDEPSLRRG